MAIREGSKQLFTSTHGAFSNGADSATLPLVADAWIRSPGAMALTVQAGPRTMLPLALPPGRAK